MKEIISEHVEAYVYHEAKQGNVESGDAYFTHLDEDYFICAIADGLGNGPVARQSAQIIPTILEEYHHESLDDLLNRCNEFMVRKRGAAVAIVKVDFKSKTIQYSCIGNVRFYMLGGSGKMVYPLPVMGYLSGRPQKIKTQEYTYEKGDLFFLHSDGVELRSPTSSLKKSSGPYNLYQNVMDSVNHSDDATFIVGSLHL